MAHSGWHAVFGADYRRGTRTTDASQECCRRATSAGDLYVPRQECRVGMLTNIVCSCERLPRSVVSRAHSRVDRYQSLARGTTSSHLHLCTTIQRHGGPSISRWLRGNTCTTTASQPTVRPTRAVTGTETPLCVCVSSSPPNRSHTHTLSRSRSHSRSRSRSRSVTRYKANARAPLVWVVFA